MDDVVGFLLCHVCGLLVSWLMYCAAILSHLGQWMWRPLWLSGVPGSWMPFLGDDGAAGAGPCGLFGGFYFCR